MHENREISWTACRKSKAGSLKAINRTADMNVQEKSDCVVVPMNCRTTKGYFQRRLGREGRRLRRTSFNLTCARHRAGKRMSQRLRGVWQAARFALPLFIPVRAVCVNAHVRICAGGVE